MFKRFWTHGSLNPIIIPTPSHNYLNIETDFIEVDEETNFSASGTQLTITDIHPEHCTSYVYKDFGVDYFRKNVEIWFELTIVSIAQEHALQGILYLTNGLGIRNDLTGDVRGGPGCRINYDSGDNTRFLLQVGGLDHIAHSHVANGPVVGTKYYVKWERVYNGGVSDNESRVTLYTDPDFTVLAKKKDESDLLMYGEIDIDLALADKTFQYLILAMSDRASYDASAIDSFVIENVEIIKNED